MAPHRARLCYRYDIGDATVCGSDTAAPAGSDDAYRPAGALPAASHCAGERPRARNRGRLRFESSALSGSRIRSCGTRFACQAPGYGARPAMCGPLHLRRGVGRNHPMGQRQFRYRGIDLDAMFDSRSSAGAAGGAARTEAGRPVLVCGARPGAGGGRECAAVAAAVDSGMAAGGGRLPFEPRDSRDSTAGRV